MLLAIEGWVKNPVLGAQLRNHFCEWPCVWQLESLVWLLVRFVTFVSNYYLENWIHSKWFLGSSPGYEIVNLLWPHKLRLLSSDASIGNTPWPWPQNPLFLGHTCSHITGLSLPLCPGHFCGRFMVSFYTTTDTVVETQFNLAPCLQPFRMALDTGPTYIHSIRL